MFNDFLVKPLFNLLAWIYGLLPVHDFGLAIIILTILVRLALWPLINKQLHSQKAMQKLQPEMARIKKEAKGDKKLESEMIMNLYKEKEISPMAPLLPIIVQMPIFIALFVVLKAVVNPHEIAKLSYDATKDLAPIADIISGAVKFHPTMLGLVDLAKSSAVLAALAGLAQFFQTKQVQPRNQENDAQAQTMKMMMYIFPALTFFVGLSLPAALALYWIMTSLIAILQQYLVLKKDEVELEAVADAGVKATLGAGSASAKSKGKKGGKK